MKVIVEFEYPSITDPNGDEASLLLEDTFGPKGVVHLAAIAAAANAVVVDAYVETDANGVCVRGE